MASGEPGTQREFTEDEARRFWEDARQRVAAGNCGFQGWYFPADPDYKGFRDLTFKGYIDFTDAAFQGDAYFALATFDAYVYFNGAEFKAYADFREATFKGDADFTNATFKGNANFMDPTFERDVQFVGATFEGSAMFFGATFKGYAYFMEATFREGLYFMHTTFQGDAEFSGAEAKKPFLLLYPWHKDRPFAIARSGETGYRLAKQAARNTGDYRSAGNYHYAEQCAINSGQRDRAVWRPWEKEFWWGELSPIRAWGEFFIGRCLFGYGERPLRVLCAALAVVLCWTCIYWVGGVVVGATEEGVPIIAHELPSSLYFSIVTFTTLGYGDFQPLPHLRLVAAAEAVLGAGLMALFIVALARKFTR